ncbi:hypothetical protein [Acetobacter persici]|uniref:Uncharacterized protein n=1 Tax=Acetobacter persici TaxID=1076596 RepID=A0A1U9LJP6_9PROT|nr:hypothetical protein [Acetobacter persici]AQT06684.1 hypothetical protein A0U91_16920 [Acetobacter persici]
MINTAEKKENRLFIRVIGRISDVKDQNAIDRQFEGSSCDPDITQCMTMNVPVLAEDTYKDLKDTISTMAEVFCPPDQEFFHPNAPLNPAGSKSCKPYSKEDWASAISAFCRFQPDRDHPDPKASPYVIADGYCPTNLVVQVIPVDNESAALDLYMECLDRFSQGERDFAEQIPESYLENDTAFLCPDGTLFSRAEAAADAGYDTGMEISFRDLMSGDYELPAPAAESHMKPGA